MGVHSNIRYNKFPKQSNLVGKPVLVIFHYELDHQFKGKIIRDDTESPFKVILELDDGRIILGTECQYSYQLTEKNE